MTKDDLSLLSVCTPIAPRDRVSEESADAGLEEDLAIIRELRSRS